MKTTTPTFRWIAAALTAVMLLAPLAPALAHACAGMSGMSGHGSMSHATMPGSSMANSSPEMGHARHADVAAHDSDVAMNGDLAGAQVSSSTSHDCAGPCAGSDCCSMQATPVPQTDGFLAERVQPVTTPAPVIATRLGALFPRADRAPPLPPQPDLLPSLLSARLHVWMATFLT